jgi:hypothetical protein
MNVVSAKKAIFNGTCKYSIIQRPCGWMKSEEPAPAIPHNYSVILLETFHALNHFSLFVRNDLPCPKPIFLKGKRALRKPLSYSEAYGPL